MTSSSTADVAVVVPTFNRLELLKETVQSLRNQTIPSARFVMVDDRSDYSTREYLKSVEAGDPRFVVIEKDEGQPQGCQVSRNIGLDACAASAVVFLDSDDLLAPNALADRYRTLSQSPQAGMVIGPEAVFTTAFSDARWVNIPREDVSDLDRFLEITHPIDVPWVNGGAMIRTAALRAANVRWRPDFDWDDVAFHFECLISGLRPVWMTFDEPDSWYRLHGGPRYGSTLSTLTGISSAGRMINWMYEMLKNAGLATEGRRASLVRALYRACVLPAIDAGETETARALVRDSRGSSLITAHEARNLLRYISGRQTLSSSTRATFYWNRFSDRLLLASFIGNGDSTYAAVPVNQPPQRIH